jgi:hypothetical protein
VSRTTQNTGGISLGAWTLIVALLPATACPADDGTATVPAASEPSSTSPAAPAPARPKIPPPRVWPQASGWTAKGQTGDVAPFSASAPASASDPALSPVHDSAGAPSAAPAQPVTRPSPAHPVPTKDTTTAAPPTAPRPEEPESDADRPQTAPVMLPAAAMGAAAPATTPAPDATQAPASPESQPPNLAQALNLGAEPDEVQVDLLAVQSNADGQVKQVACATCGGFHSAGDAPMFHEAMGCDTGSCIPGRQPCNLPNIPCNTVCGAFIQNLYQCLCCPDPCYQPGWVPAANASFFADYARPRTVTRLRYDNLEAMNRPDRNQFWIQGVTAMRKNGRPVINPQARLQQFYLYQEVAGERGSFFIEYPYRQINQSWAPTQSGFSDLNFGIKSLLFDCELLQVSFQFRTYTPTGNALLNLGTGHFALDPSILTSLKLGPTTYFQGQFGNWIPLAGNQSLAGGVFYWLMSVNQVLAYTTPDSPLIATLEMDGWSFENGGYTAAIAPGQKPIYAEKGGGVSYFNIGPGLRQSICNRFDIGGAITWATSSVHWAQPWFRFEARFLF